MTAVAAMQTTVVLLTFLLLLSLLLVLGLEDEACPPRVTQTCVKDTVSNRGRLQAEGIEILERCYQRGKETQSVA